MNGRGPVTARHLVADRSVAPDALADGTAAANQLASLASWLRRGDLGSSTMPVRATLGDLHRLRSTLGTVSGPAATTIGVGYSTDEAVSLGRDPEDIQMYDAYFGIARVRETTHVVHLAQALPTMIETIAGITSGPSRRDHNADIVDLFSHLIRRHLVAIETQADAVPDRAPGSAPAVIEPPSLPLAVDLSPLRQWIVGHRIYALANRCAAAHIDAATDHSIDGAIDPAADELDLASRDIAALTASMNYAGSMTSYQYRNDVRPTMGQPTSEVELTGGMNLDHATYRKAIENFLTECGMDYADLADQSKILAEARDRLLYADLYDMETHIELTYRLVGSAPALDEREDGSAVQALRGMQVRRLRRYSPMLRLGARTA